MAYWICPECSRKIDSTLDECPYESSCVRNFLVRAKIENNILKDCTLKNNKLTLEYEGYKISYEIDGEGSI